MRINMSHLVNRTAMLAIGGLLFLSASSQATTYYVATNGNDTWSGTATNSPWRTPERGIGAVNAGDTLYVFGGTYMLTNQVKTAKAGTAVNYCNMWAYPGEHPYFNATNIPSGSNRGIYISKDFWHVKGIEVGFAPDNGIIITSGSNIVEGCVMHDNNNDGMTLGSTSAKAHDNLILNCDSYRNFQASSGGNNGDGYSAKTGCGVNNVFQGCRSYLNSDDGWDFYDNDSSTVTLLNCWSFMNGSNQWNVGSFSGNGNGFKLGGAGTHAQHVLMQCVAFDNIAKGFDYNLSVAGHTMLNCTSFGNGKPNYEFPATPTTGTNTFKNDVSYLGSNDIVAGSIMISNSWQNGLSVNAADFASLDVALAQMPRNSDYSLPTNSFARLAAGSDLIDAGVDVGLPYYGSAPDLGAYEFVATATAPTAGFTASPTSGTEPLTVTFTDASSGSPTNLFWDLGDSTTTNTAAGASFAHAYVAGTYTVTLTASNSAGTSTLVSNNLITVITAWQAWQLQYFGCTNCAQADGDADPDGDGMSNTNEFLTGNNPTSSLSALRIISAVAQGNDVVITWTTAGGRTNAVQATSGDAGGNYTDNFTNTSGLIVVQGTGDVTTNYVDVNGGTNSPARYYRIRLVP